jgi:hypothetical protein
MEKVIASSYTEKSVLLPGPDDSITYPLVEKDGREPFQLDINRGRRIDKWTFQLRNRNVTILVGLDIGGPAHPNPDNAPNGALRPFEGMRIPCPHLQRYVAGYGDGWAIPAPPNMGQVGNMEETWRQFLAYCNITTMPALQWGLV